MVRVRNPHGGSATITSATVSDPATADCALAHTLPEMELVAVQPTAAAAKGALVRRCELSVHFSPTTASTWAGAAEQPAK